MQWDTHNIIYVIFLPKAQNWNLISRKQSHKARLRNVLHDNCPGLFKTVNVLKQTKEKEQGIKGTDNQILPPWLDTKCPLKKCYKRYFRINEKNVIIGYKLDKIIV